MKFLIILGSPRRNGHTAALLEPFAGRLKELKAETEQVTLADLRILPCKGCGHCQNVQDEYGCLIDDDMTFVVDKIREADCIVLATPIYSWYCTAEMKALLDRHYGLNKYYGTATGSLWAGKALALITTHGYGDAYANSPLEDGIQRLCKHSNLKYLGRCSARDLGNDEAFLTQEAAAKARDFAEKLVRLSAEAGLNTAEVVLEGNRFHDLDEFTEEIERLLKNAAQDRALTVRWHDFTQSLRVLGQSNAEALICLMESSRPEGGCVVNTKD